MVSSRKELATVLGQTKEKGEMLEYVQSLFYPFEGQSSSDLGDLFLPALAPILSPLIRDIWAANGFITPFIGLPLATVPEEALHHLHRFTNTLAEKRRQESKGTRAGFTEIALYPNYQLPTPYRVSPVPIKAMPNDLIGSAALRAKFFVGKMVIFSPLSIILDRDTKACPELDSGSYTIIFVLKRPLKVFSVGLTPIILITFKGFSVYRGSFFLNKLAIFYITRLDDCE